MKKIFIMIAAVAALASCTSSIEQQLMDQSISEISKTIKCPSSLVVRGATMIHIDIDSLRVSDSLYLVKQIKEEDYAPMRKYYKKKFRDFKKFDWSSYYSQKDSTNYGFAESNSIDYILIAYDAQNSYGAMIRDYALFSFHGNHLGSNYTDWYFEKDKYGYFIGCIYLDSNFLREYGESDYHPHYIVSYNDNWVEYK